MPTPTIAGTCPPRRIKRHVRVSRTIATLCAGQRIDPGLYERAAWCGLL